MTKLIIKCDDPLHLEICLEIALRCAKQRGPDWSDIVGFQVGDNQYWAHFLKSGTISISKAEGR